MELSAGEAMARIHGTWCGKDDVKVNLFSQWRGTGAFIILPQSKCLIQVRCPEMFISLL